MIKLVICLVCALVIGAVSLQLRQQQLELRHTAVSLQENIERQQSRLWSQQMQISVYTSPKALARTLSKEMPLVPEGNLPPEVAQWVREDAD